MIHSFINKMNVISLGFILRHDPSKNNPSLSGLKILSGEPRDAQVRAWPFVYTERKPFSKDTIPVAVHRRASERGSDGGREGGSETRKPSFKKKKMALEIKGVFVCSPISVPGSNGALQPFRDVDSEQHCNYRILLH